MTIVFYIKHGYYKEKFNFVCSYGLKSSELTVNDLQNAQEVYQIVRL